MDKTLHTYNGEWLACTDRNKHYQYCTVCNVWKTSGADCRNSSGQVIGCSTGISGTCIDCGAYRSGSQHGVVVATYTSYSVSDTTITQAGNIVCNDCHNILGIYSITTYRISSTQSKAVLDAETYFDIPTVTMNISNCSNIQHNGVTFQVTSLSQSGNNLHSEGIVSHNSNNLAPGAYEIDFRTNEFYNTSFVNNSTWIHMDGIFISDWDAPLYDSSHVDYYSYVNGYATRAVLNAKYYEGYSNECYIRLLDSDGETVISDWGSATKNGTTFTRNIDITDEVNGSKILYLQAKDTIGNMSGLTAIMVSNLDSKAPTQTSVSSTATNWSKTKDFTFTATDVGSGNVQIAFHNTNDYEIAIKSGASYSRDYTFTGDVYGNVMAAIYVKDSVGNETTKFINIYNLDNTPPIITSVTSAVVSNSKVSFTISANDNKDFGDAVGVKAGSGVSSYAISTSAEAPTIGWQTSNTLYAMAGGTYYLFAKDTVGNISTPYTVKVITLIIHSAADAGGTNSYEKWCASSTTYFIIITRSYTTKHGEVSRRLSLRD